jgi:hypothetical protein
LSELLTPAGHPKASPAKAHDFEIFRVDEGAAGFAGCARPTEPEVGPKRRLVGFSSVGS